MIFFNFFFTIFHPFSRGAVSEAHVPCYLSVTRELPFPMVLCVAEHYFCFLNSSKYGRPILNLRLHNFSGSSAIDVRAEPGRFSYWVLFRIVCRKNRTEDGCQQRHRSNVHFVHKSESFSMLSKYSYVRRMSDCDNRQFITLCGYRAGTSASVCTHHAAAHTFSIENLFVFNFYLHLNLLLLISSLLRVKALISLVCRTPCMRQFRKQK